MFNDVDALRMWQRLSSLRLTSSPIGSAMKRVIEWSYTSHAEIYIYIYNLIDNFKIYTIYLSNFENIYDLIKEFWEGHLREGQLHGRVRFYFLFFSRLKFWQILMEYIPPKKGGNSQCKNYTRATLFQMHVSSVKPCTFFF